jgi:hypothetical protein
MWRVTDPVPVDDAAVIAELADMVIPGFRS